uniref:Uncharacterized protein n=1 Tax=Arundo donax TaxID=35708 RepID=A0A0A9FUH1_ARUDO
MTGRRKTSSASLATIHQEPLCLIYT